MFIWNSHLTVYPFVLFSSKSGNPTNGSYPDPSTSCLPSAPTFQISPHLPYFFFPFLLTLFLLINYIIYLNITFIVSRLLWKNDLHVSSSSIKANLICDQKFLFLNTFLFYCFEGLEVYENTWENIGTAISPFYFHTFNAYTHMLI